MQWDANYESTPLTEAFAYRFLSFELGLVKPDREIFDAVAGRLPVPRTQVLFLDDNAVNVDAAGGGLRGPARARRRRHVPRCSSGVLSG